jgi:hypothetical protein
MGRRALTYRPILGDEVDFEENLWSIMHLGVPWSTALSAEDDLEEPELASILGLYAGFSYG